MKYDVEVVEDHDSVTAFLWRKRVFGRSLVASSSKLKVVDEPVFTQMIVEREIDWLWSLVRTS